MKKLMYSLTIAALFAVATVASANDLPYEDDGGYPDDPVPTEESIDLGGRGVTQGSEGADLDGAMLNVLRNWVALLSTIVTLPNRSQING